MKYVYLINEIGTDNYKLGKSQNTKTRLNNLQTGNSTTLQLVASFQTYDFTLLESILHDTFKTNNITREWFKFEPKILSEVIQIMHNVCIKVNKESDLYEEPVINSTVKEKTECMCHKCKKKFTQKWLLDRHLNRKTQCDKQIIINGVLKCEDCDKIFKTSKSIYYHVRNKVCKKNQ